MSDGVHNSVASIKQKIVTQQNNIVSDQLANRAQSRRAHTYRLKQLQVRGIVQTEMTKITEVDNLFHTCGKSRVVEIEKAICCCKNRREIDLNCETCDWRPTTACTRYFNRTPLEVSSFLITLSGLSPFWYVLFWGHLWHIRAFYGVYLLENGGRVAAVRLCRLIPTL